MTTARRGRTALYRAFNSSGQLLYVGISVHPEQRFKQHASQKEWWRNETVQTTIEWHDDELRARKAEARAVRDESPIHNLTLPDEDGSPRFRHIIYGRDLCYRPLKQLPPGAPRPRGFKVPTDLWKRFGDAVENSPDPEADMSKVLRQFLRWYVGEPKAKLPDQPGTGPWSTPGGSEAQDG